MGRYINPVGMTKEEFLYTKGKPIPRTFKFSEVPDGFLPVVLVNMGSFTCAAICRNQADFEERLTEKQIECFLVSLQDIATAERDLPLSEMK